MSATGGTRPSGGLPPQPQEPKDIWQAMNQSNIGLQGDNVSDDTIANTQPDVVRNAVVQAAYNEMYESSDHLLFGARRQDLDLASLHPPSSRMFKYWQIFLDNANPLLKIIHAPTFQARLVDAISDLSAATAPMHALLFGMYSMAVHTLDDVTTQKALGSEKHKLLGTYHFACQQALLSCGVLRTTEREVLVALFLYLISTRDKTDPRTLSSTLGIAARLAQRMGLHSEAANCRCQPFEAEMRRRLWWALAIFDSRTSDMAGSKASMLLNPTWDCKVPANLDDSQLWLDMSHPPIPSTGLGDAIYVTVRSEIDDFIRSSGFYLDFTNPILMPLARLSNGGLSGLESHLENSYIRHCTADNPVHLMTQWTTRGLLAKNHLFQYYAEQSGSAKTSPNTQRDRAVTHCLHMLEADTCLMTAQAIKGYHWLIHFQFPFPAYLHILQDIRRRPDSPHAQQCWEAMSDNYDARFLDIEPHVGLFHKLIAKLIVQTWLDTAVEDPEHPSTPVVPRIVAHVARKAGIDFSQYHGTQPSRNAPSGLTQKPASESARASFEFNHEQDPIQSLTSFSNMSEYAFDLIQDEFDWNAFDMDSLFAPS